MKIQSKSCIIKMLVTLLIISLFSSITSGAGSATIVKISPKELNVVKGDNFTLNITVEPSQPIRAIEFKLSFNPLLLEVKSIVKGDLFDGFETIFNSGTIDNDEGIVYNVYSAILSKGNTSNPGIFVLINFSAKQQNGSCYLRLYDVRVTNETNYVPINIENSKVIIGKEDSSSGGSSGGGSSGGENDAPSIPIIKLNSLNYYINISYDFSLISIDSNDDNIFYLIDWGDSSYSDWIGPFNSNETIFTNHTWNKTGNFDIKVKAKDIFDFESSWSDQIPIVVGKNESLENIIKPIVDFSYSPLDPVLGEMIQFQDLSSVLDGNISKWVWYFGDNNTSSVQNPLHKYLNAGQYNVTLVILDNKNIVNSTSKNIVVKENGSIVDNKETPFFSFIELFLILFVGLAFIIIFKNQKIKL